MNNCKINLSLPNLWEKLQKVMIDGSNINMQPLKQLSILFPKNEVINVLSYGKSKFKDHKVLSRKIELLISNIDSLYPKTDLKIIFLAKFDYKLRQSCLLKELTDGSFSSVCSSKLSEFIYKSIENDIFRITLWDKKNNSIIRTTKDLNRSITDYLNLLINVLMDFVSKNLENSSYVYSLPSTYTKNKGEGVRKLLIDTWSIFQSMFTDKQIDLNLSQNNLDNVISPLKAFYVLNNFDEIINNFSGKLITIDPKQEGYFEIYGEKYFKISNNHKFSSFEDTAWDLDSDKWTDEFLYRFFQSIQNPSRTGTLSKTELNLICTEIRTLLANLVDLPGKSIDDNEVTTSELLNSIFDSSLDLDTRIDSLFNLIRGHLKTTDVGYDVSDEFDKFQAAYKKELKKFNGTLVEKQEFENRYNLGAIFLQHVINNTPNSFIARTENGIEEKNINRINKNKQFIRNKIKHALIENLKDMNNIGIYNPQFRLGNTEQTISTFSDVYDQSFVNFVLKATGIDLSSNGVQELIFNYAKNNKNGIEHLSSFLTKFLQDVLKKLIPYRKKIDFEKRVDDFIDKLAYSPDYIVLSNIIVTYNSSNVDKIYDLSKNLQPVLGASTTIARIKENINDFLKQRNLITRQESLNILLKYPEINSLYEDESKPYSLIVTNRIAYRLDVYLKNGRVESIKKAHELTDAETVTTQINDEFIDAMISHDAFYNLIECVSDKVRIPLSIYNVARKFKLDKSNVSISLGTASESDLKTLYRRQFIDYFQDIRSMLISDYKLLFDTLGITIDSDNKNQQELLDSYILLLEQLKEQDIENAIAKIQKINPNYKFIKELHYCTNKGKILFNNSLYYYFRICNESKNNPKLLNEILDKSFNYTKEYILKNAIPLTFTNKLSAENYVKENGDKFLSYLGLRFSSLNDRSLAKDALVAWIKSKQLVPSKNIESMKIGNQYIFDIFLKKYNLLLALARDAELQVSTKNSFIHKGKLKRNPLTFNELQNMSYDLFKEDISARLTVGKKRNNSLVASYLIPIVNQECGIPETMECAIGEAHVLKLINFNGLLHNLELSDGGIFTCGFWANWDDKSYAGKYFRGSKKVIGIIPTFGSITQIKCADYRINNELLRCSFTESDTNRINMYQLFKKMTHRLRSSDIESINILLSRLNQRKSENSLVIGKNAYIDVNGVKAKLTDIEVTLDNLIRPVYAYDEGENKNEIVEDDLIYQILDLDHFRLNLDDEILIRDNKLYYKVKSLFDLWLLFGGKDSFDKTDQGDYVLGENSMDLVSIICNEYGQEAKNSVTAKYLDETTVKSGIINSNSLNRVNDESKDLLTFTMDSSRIGIQQDYTHDADESQIPQLTLTNSGIAFNGMNIELVDSLYEDLGSIVEESMSPILNKFNSDNDRVQFHKFAANTLKRILSTNDSVSSNALLKVQQALTEIKNYLEEKGKNNNIQYVKSLAYSDPEIFYVMSNALLVKLNEDGIKQKFPGIAVILNPSHGIVGIYEGHENGEYKTYKYNDILQMARNAGYDGNPTDAINLFLEKDARFTPEIISSIADLTIGDTVNITTNENGNVSTVKRIIDNPVVLWEIEKQFNKENTIILKIYNVKRDLKTLNVNWIEVNKIENSSELSATTVKNSLWNILSTRLNLVMSKALKESDVDEYTKTVIKDLKDKGKWNKIYIEKFYKNNLNGLGEKKSNPFYYKTIEDFENNIKTPVYKSYINENNYVAGVNYKAGELIIPKVYKTRQRLNHSLAYIRDNGVMYFYNLISDEFKQNNTFSSNLDENKHFCATLIRKNDEIVLTNYVDDLDLSYQDAVIKKNELGEYWIIDKTGVPFIQVPSDSKYKIKTLQITGSNKQLIILSTNDKYLATKTARMIEDVNAYHNNLQFKEIEKLNHIDISNPKILNSYILKRARQMYMSWKLTNKTISVRIPSQSFQSFLATETVAYTDGDLNDGYMNIWEMWFLGSDFDIDKAYTLMFNIDDSGVLYGSEFINWTDEDSILTSLQDLISKPNKDLKLEPMSDEDYNSSKDDNSMLLNSFITVDDKKLFFSDIDEYIRKNPNDHNKIFNSLLKYFENSKGIFKINTKYKFEETIDPNTKETVIKKVDNNRNSRPFKWMYELNNYNKSSKYHSEFIKNKAVTTIWKTTSDLQNLEAATQPMDNHLVTNQIDKIKKDNTIYDPISNVTIAKIQYENSVGKTNVGIAANGIKVASSLLQFYNKRALYGKLKETFVGNQDLIFNRLLNENNKYTPICTFKMQKVANLNVDKTAFDEMLIKAFKASGESDYDKWLKNNSIIKFIFDSKNSHYRDESGHLLDYYDKLLNIYNLYSRETNKLFKNWNNEDIVNFLYYTSLFEENAADLLSVMISLSTDNAKELKLAIMNATPELMSIPLALITYGMDIRSIIDICVNPMGIIAKYLSSNKFKKQNKVSIEDAISLAEKNKEFDKDTANSFRKIILVTEELRALSSFYKINQGVSTDFIDLNIFINKLLQIKLNKLKHLLFLNNIKTAIQLANKLSKNISNFTENEKLIYSLVMNGADLVQSNGVDLDLNIKDFVRIINYYNQDLDIYKLFNDDLYKNDMIKFFNLISALFNLLDVIMSSRIYQSQLEATVNITDIIKTMSAKAGITNALMTGVKYTDKDNNVHEIKINQANDTRSWKKILRIIDHYVVGKALKTKNFSKFKFSLFNLKHQLGNNAINLPHILEYATFGLNTTYGVNAFIDLMNTYMIPKFLEMYKDNMFMRSLVIMPNYDNNGVNSYGVKYNAFANDEDISELLSIEEAKADFLKIMNNLSGIKNTLNEDITIGELFYVYNLIQHKGLVNSMQSCIVEPFNTTNKGKSLINTVSDIYHNLDKLMQIQNGKFEDNDSELNIDLLRKFELIANALESDSKIAVNSDMTKFIDLNKLFIYTDALTINRDGYLKGDDNYLSFRTYISDYFNDKYNTKWISPKHIKINVDNKLNVATVTLTADYSKLNDKLQLSDKISLSTDINEYGFFDSGLASLLIYELDEKLQIGYLLLGNLDVVNVENISIKDKNGINNLIGALEISSDYDKEILKLFSDKNLNITLIRANSSYGLIEKLGNLIYLLCPTSWDNSEMYDNEKLDLLLSMVYGSSDQNKLIGLMNMYKLDKDIIINNQNFKSYLSDLNKYIKFPDKIKNYIEYNLFNQIPLIIKEKANLEIYKFLNIYQNDQLRPLYYSESNDKKLVIKTGDIFEKDNELYIYLGNIYQNKLGFFRISNIKNNTIPNLELASTILKFHKKYNLNLSPYTILGSLSKHQFTYENEVKTKTRDELEIGDIILNGNEELFVSDIIYSESGEVKYLVKQNDLIFDLSEINKDLTYNVKSIKTARLDTSVKLDISTLEFSKNNPFTLDFKKYVIPNYLITDMNDNKHIINHIDIYNNLIITRDNKSIPFQDIKTVQVPSKLVTLDKEFQSEIKSKKYIVNLQYADIIAASLRLANYKASSGKDNNNIMFELNEPFMMHHKKVTNVKNYDYQINDIIKVTEPDNTIIYYLILNTDENGNYWCSASTNGTNSYVIRNFNNIENIEVYSVNSLNNNLLQTQNILDLNIKENTDLYTSVLRGEMVMQALSDKFGLDISIKDLGENMHFAEIQDGKIIINLGLYNTYKNQLPKKDLNNFTIEQYVITQGIHEFTHLMLTNIQSKNPDLYYDIMLYAKLIFEKNITKDPIINKILKSDSYKTNDEKYQEYIVRKIEDYFRNSADNIDFDSDESIIRDLTNKLNKGFSLFFNLNNITNMLDRPVNDFFYDFIRNSFDYSTSQFNLENLRKNTLNSEIMDQIICK